MDKITILWTTDNIITIKNMILLYAKNAKIMGWFDEVKIIIWGASSKIITKNEWLQRELQDLIRKDVEVIACLACSDNLGVTDQLKALGIKVAYVGEDLSKILKSDEKVLSI